MEMSDWDRGQAIYDAELREYSKFVRSQEELFRRTHNYKDLTIEQDFRVICKVYSDELLSDPEEHKILLDCIDFQCKSSDNFEKLYLDCLKKFGDKIYIYQMLINYYMGGLEYKPLTILYERFKEKYGRSKFIEKWLSDPIIC